MFANQFDARSFAVFGPKKNDKNMPKKVKITIMDNP